MHSPNKSWEFMGRPDMVWSPIQLRLVIKYKIHPTIRVKDV